MGRSLSGCADLPLSWSTPCRPIRQRTWRSCGRAYYGVIMGRPFDRVDSTSRSARITGWFRRSSRPLPILVLLGLLASGRASAWRAALAGLATACAVAWLVFGMPARMIAASMAVGVVVRPFADRLADRGRGLPLRYHRRDGPVRGHEGVGGPAIGRPSLASRAGRVLLRRVHRGGRRIRRPGRDLRGLPGGTGVSAV